MITRPYQDDARTSVHGEWRKGIRSTLVVAPTGCGKTVIASQIIKDIQPGRTMLVAHRRELIFQAADTIRRHAGLECGIEMAERCVNEGFLPVPVVCAMVQTLNAKEGMAKRMGRFRPENFSLLIIDEFHRAVAESYGNVINYLKQNPALKILGLTATPDRADSEALKQVCDSVAYQYQIQDAIHDGWLVEPLQYCVHVKSLDFSHINTRAGDLDQGQLAKVMEAEEPLHRVVQATLEVMFRLEPHALDKLKVDEWGDYLRSQKWPPRRTLVFTVSVMQAEMLCNIFNRVIPGAFGWVCGKTADTDRADLLRRFANGEIHGVVNCNCLSEGFDNPGVEVVVQARPTKSRSLYAQQIGRGLRPLPGIVDAYDQADERRRQISYSPKPNAIVLDFVGNSGRHKLVTTADILGGKVTDKAMARAAALAAKLGKPVSILELVETSEKQEQAAVLKAKQAEEAKRAKLVARAKFNSARIDPFDVFGISPVQPRRLDSSRVLSEKRRDVLINNGVDPDSVPYEQACQLLDEIFRRWRENKCGLKLATVLKRKNLNTNVSTEEAVRQIRGAAIPIKMKVTQPEEGVIFELLPQR